MTRLQNAVLNFVLNFLVGYVVGTVAADRSVGRRVGLGFGLVGGVGAYIVAGLHSAADEGAGGSEPVDIEVESPKQS